MKRFDSTDSIVSNVRGNVSAFAKPAMPWSCAKLLLQATNQQQQRERKSKTAKKNPYSAAFDVDGCAKEWLEHIYE